MPKVYIKTFGCQMNDRDSEALAGLFLEQGYSLTENPEDADVILVNTCSVRQHAENRAISFLGTLKKVTKSLSFAKATEGKQGHKVTSRRRNTQYAQRNTKIVGLIGCMAKNRGEEIFRRMPHIDLVVGPANFDRIPEYVEKITNYKFQISNSEKRVRIIDLEDRLRNEDFYRAPFRQELGHAQVVISTGCSNYCSYCLVPFVRGPLRLRNPKDIIDEIKRNVRLGIKKITLLGQNVNDYYIKSKIKNQKSKILDFVGLLKMVEEVEGVEEIDFVTSHPKNTSKELFYLMAESKKIRKHLHLPFQSGSDRILKLMNRGYTKKDYIDLVKDYRSIVKGTLSTDVIVGFPTEAEEDFLQTKKVLEEVRFNYAYIFKYSSRPKTKASELVDDVFKEEKERRHKILLDLQKEISLSKKIDFVAFSCEKPKTES